MVKRPYQVDVDLDVFKALTALIKTEGQEHNDVLRELLNLDSVLEAESPEPITDPQLIAARFNHPGQFYSRGLVLPNGTKLRARYKGVQHFAEIRDGRWFADDGAEFSSPSAAASAITRTTVNGWRFWEGMLPGDNGWRRLEVIRNSYPLQQR
ncbi:MULTISPECIES: DUF2924 domain-containing protein [Novosphingobium]|uniref:DUF2924 domain-containing protein n=1 Tax=Novosphingobium TaxID=165696 RepID=UPI000D6E17ED|nr:MULTISPECIES: DUF2924 domain-containing protein [Novosphingobium]